MTVYLYTTQHYAHVQVHHGVQITVLHVHTHAHTANAHINLCVNTFVIEKAGCYDPNSWCVHCVLILLAVVVWITQRWCRGAECVLFWLLLCALCVHKLNGWNVTWVPFSSLTPYCLETVWEYPKGKLMFMCAWPSVIAKLCFWIHIHWRLPIIGLSENWIKN